MRDVQVVLIDSEIELPPAELPVEERRMLRDDPSDPRLAPYYLSPNERPADNG